MLRGECEGLMEKKRWKDDTDDFLLRITYFARSCWGFDLQEEHDFIEKSHGSRSSRGNRVYGR
jgi:hypothetical protein